MEKAPAELMNEYVNSQKFTSTTEIIEEMKAMFGDVLQQVMEAELDTKLGYEKSERTSNDDENGLSKNYRNGHSKKTVKTQLGEVTINIPRDRNGEYEPSIIKKYSRNADGRRKAIAERRANRLRRMVGRAGRRLKRLARSCRRRRLGYLGGFCKAYGFERRA